MWHGDDREGNHTTHARLSDGGTLPFGAMVWSAGLALVRFVERLDALPKQELGVSSLVCVDGASSQVVA